MADIGTLTQLSKRSAAGLVVDNQPQEFTVPPSAEHSNGASAASADATPEELLEACLALITYETIEESPRASEH